VVKVLDVLPPVEPCRLDLTAFDPSFIDGDEEYVRKQIIASRLTAAGIAGVDQAIYGLFKITEKPGEATQPAIKTRQSLIAIPVVKGPAQIRPNT
jgi:hypothetical protein